jgi:virginiamycin B lyase
MAKRYLLTSAALCALMLDVSPSFAQGLSGKAAIDGAALEGVLVSAKKEGSNITTTVVTDSSGSYSFPADRLAPGKYALSIRAIGYVLDGPKTTEVADGKAGSADIKLSKTKNLASQLSNAEWIMSIPAPDREKEFLDNCASCHTVQRIMNSTYNAEDFLGIFQRMGTYSPGSMPTKPQPLLPGPRGERPRINPAIAQRSAELLARVNLSESPTRNYELKTLPLPKGRGTKVIYTEYDLPAKDWQPHDVVVDRDGMAWFSDFGDQRMGRLDPKTGKVEIIALPLLKNDGSPKGGLEIDEAPNGDIWVAGMYQGGVYRWERATGKVITYKIPDQYQSPSTQESMVSPDHSDVDGYVWTNNQEDHSLFRIKVATGEIEYMGVSKDASGKPIPGYGMPTDLKNRPLLLEFGGTRIGHFDPEKKIAEVFNTPFAGARPRRGRVDAKGRMWYSEYGANAFGMFDPETKKLEEYILPTAWTKPYDAYGTRNGNVWGGSMLTDQVFRLNVATGETIEYQLPRPTNIRRVFVDEKGPREILWVGSNHGASVVRVEPLD